MRLPKFIRSPLAATAGVVLGMTLIAIPLRHLTSGAAAAAPQAPSINTQALTPAWISLRLLAPVKSAALQTSNGEVIWKLDAIPADEIEIRKPLPLVKHRLELILNVEWAEPSAESAAFLSIEPDGLEQSTRYLIGSGSARELLTFTWPNS